MKPDAIVAVAGSLNIDHTFRVPRIPAPGESLTATGAFTCFGGKGANQAIAAARAGARVHMIGCLGTDDPGTAYRDHLAAEGIDSSAVAATADTATGSAFITVDNSGENAIVVHPGANHALTPAMVDAFATVLDGAQVLLLQLECPLPAVKRAADLARLADATVILNPSPWDDQIRDVEIPIDIFIVNESEARLLTGIDPDHLADDPSAALAAAGCGTLIITRGAGATLVISGDGLLQITPPTVTPVDTVGAGDTFAGAFAVAHAEGMSLPKAAGFANHAAALATLQPGAQTAIPTREQIWSFAESTRS